MVYVFHQGWGELGWGGSTVLSQKGQISPSQQTARWVPQHPGLKELSALIEA